jgi:predicted dehydrogenase
MRAMRAGKDVIADKPGIISYDQLEAMTACIAETGKFYSICFSERLCVRSAIKAGHLVKSGAIGQVIQTIGTGPHRKSLNVRPDWFFDMTKVGGIITDIASHQIDQFLFYTGATGAEVASSSVGNFDTDHAGFEDFGEVLLRSPDASGYIRVDWFTPDGLKNWGDGRLTILGTKGYIELRKYIDIAGREGGNHLFLVDGTDTTHIDCKDVKLDYFDQFVADVKNRTETAMSQAHVLEVCRLSLDAQSRAARLGHLK